MPLILYINGERADLEAGQVIARTLQVNDLNSLDSRQASYTNKFRLPKTASNTRIMQFLTLPGNTSAVPYQKNECSLYSDNGECFVYKGRAVVTDGGDSYDVVVYDGIIDLYKAIENKTLAAIDLSDLEHEKSMAEVTGSWNTAANLPYRYILADYNGNTGDTAASPAMVNIDYLVPAVNVAWLWEKIFTSHEMSYTGSIFESESFRNLWLTYPKGIATTDEGTEIFNSTESVPYNASANSSLPWGDHHWKNLLVKYNNPDPFNTNFLHTDTNGYRLKVKEPGIYKIMVSGTINCKDKVRLFLGKNVNYTNNDALFSVQVFRELASVINSNVNFEAESQGFELAANDSISLMMRATGFPQTSIRFHDGEKWDLEITLKKLTLSDISFSDAFADFSIRDFLAEIVNRFGLTIHKGKYDNNYEFRTLEEQLQTAMVTDWSGKFSKKLSEDYIYGSYAQRNWFRYNYNDKESTHNDGFIDVANVNLPDSKDLIKSKIYSPEKQKSVYLNRTANVYRLWDKEVKEDPAEGEDPVTYKALDKRYYLLRAEQKNMPVTLYSQTVEGTQQASSVWVENYWRLSFSDIIQEYYQPLAQVLEKALIVTVELWLKDTDIANFDFRKLYYFEQLSACFMMNKISNYVQGRPTKCELVRVIPAAPELEEPPIAITRVKTAGYYAQTFFTVNIPNTSLVFEYKRVGDSGWGSIGFSNITNSWGYHLSPPGTWMLRIKAGTIYSNTVEVPIPSTAQYDF
jgi:hypothetical protein